MGLEVNKAIKTISQFAEDHFKGVGDSLRYAKSGRFTSASSNIGSGGVGMSSNLGPYKKMGTWDAIKEGHKAVGDEMSIGGYGVKRMAGSYIAASSAARVVSGGGLYKDRDGNTDIIGLPII